MCAYLEIVITQNNLTNNAIVNLLVGLPQIARILDTEFRLSILIHIKRFVENTRQASYGVIQRIRQRQKLCIRNWTNNKEWNIA